MASVEILNQLIEQNEARTQAVALEAERAQDIVTQLDQSINHLTNNLTSTSAETQESFLIFNQTLDEIESELNEAVTAKENLSNLSARTNELATQLDSITETTKIQLSELQNQAEEMLADLEAETNSIRSNFEQQAQTIQTLEAEVENQAETSKNDTDEYNNLVEDAHLSMEEHKGLLLETFTSLESEVQENLEAIRADFSILIEEGQNQHFELENLLDNSSSEALDILTQRFVDEVPSELSQAMQELDEAFSILGNTGVSSAEILGGRLGDVIEGIGDVLDKIEPVLDVLHKVKTLLL